MKIKPGHVQPVWAGHPWVYAQAVEDVEGGALAGDEVLVEDARGNVLGRGLYSPKSAIAVRMYTRDRDTAIDASLLRRRIEQAIARRRALGLPASDTDAYRLIHAEGDDLPGLIVDRFADVLALQFGTIGMKRRSALILDSLMRLLEPRAILDRTPLRVAQAEDFEPAAGVVRGDAGVTELSFSELGARYRIPLELGQKTGFYLDQRGLRARVSELSRDRRVLDAFCYVGAVAMAAARGGARSVDAVDSNALALEVAARCAEQNGVLGTIQFERADAYERLRLAGASGGYDLVVCDPPKLAPTRASQRRALGNMQRLASAAFRATRPFGICVLCSCSAALGLPELTRATALGGREVNVRPVVLEQFSQGPDHPVLAAFPEGRYLSTIICEVVPL